MSLPTRKRRYEFGNATVFVLSAGGKIFDGIIRSDFICKVHPVRGDVFETRVKAFYPFLAASTALEIWDESRKAQS